MRARRCTRTKEIYGEGSLYGVIGAYLSAVATGCLMLMIDAARSWQESPTCDHTRRIPCVIMSLRDALEHDAGASCRAIAGLDRAPVQAMVMAGIGPRPERTWHALEKAEGMGESGRTTKS